MSVYVVAGRDLESFVNGWLVDVEPGTREESLLTAAEDARVKGNFDSEYLFNAGYLMVNIAPRAATEDATEDELLLAAVLVAYQRTNNLFRGMRWVSRENHLAQAFRHAQEMGDAGMARFLIADVLRQEDSDSWQDYKSRTAAENPAEAARIEGQMAELAQRELRAAALFDPTVDFDSIWLGGTGH